MVFAFLAGVCFECGIKRESCSVMATNSVWFSVVVSRVVSGRTVLVVKPSVVFAVPALFEVLERFSVFRFKFLSFEVVQKSLQNHSDDMKNDWETDEKGAKAEEDVKNDFHFLFFSMMDKILLTKS